MEAGERDGFKLKLLTAEVKLVTISSNESEEALTFNYGLCDVWVKFRCVTDLYAGLSTYENCQERLRRRLARNSKKEHRQNLPQY